MCDFVLVTGDSYVDHPSFGAAIIARVLEADGFSVSILAQPDINNPKSFKKFGTPKLGFLVTAGNIDSMVAHYTAAKKRRSDDAYTAGGKHGKRPDRAVTVYCRKIREIFGGVNIIIGGLEASLRRFAHYDYWSDAVMPSVLVDSTANLLVFGMGERAIRKIAERLKNDEKIAEIRDIKGTCFLVKPEETPHGYVQCPGFKEVCADKKAYARACKIQYENQDESKGILQRHGGVMLVQNPPSEALNEAEMDEVYALPFSRAYSPEYEKAGGVPAIEEVKFSITHNRGCFGACNFCAITLHQGRKISWRSKKSVVEEARILTKMPDFKGYIHDVGGPTANFRKDACDKKGYCKGKKCLAPEKCPSLKAEHGEYLGILRAVRELKGVKKVFVRSGIRFDYLMHDSDGAFFKELVAHHISGQLKIAPEHCVNRVLDKMGKPHIEVYERFSRRFYALTKSLGKEQYLVPYLISSHPGAGLKDAVAMAVYLKKNKLRPEQVQDFYPTPGTVSTCMYYTGLDPFTGEQVYVAKTAEEKAMQRALLQYFNPKNRPLVIKALKLTGRQDLINFLK